MWNDIDDFLFGLLDGSIETSSGTEKENFIPSGYCLLASWYKFVLFFP